MMASFVEELAARRAALAERRARLDTGRFAPGERRIFAVLAAGGSLFRRMGGARGARLLSADCRAEHAVRRETIAGLEDAGFLVEQHRRDSADEQWHLTDDGRAAASRCPDRGCRGGAGRAHRPDCEFVWAINASAPPGRLASVSGRRVAACDRRRVRAQASGAAPPAPARRRAARRGGTAGDDSDRGGP